MHPSPARCNVERRSRSLRRLAEALRRGPAARHTSRRGVRSLQGRRRQLRLKTCALRLSSRPAFTAGSPPRRCLPSSSTRLGRRVQRAFDSPFLFGPSPRPRGRAERLHGVDPLQRLSQTSSPGGPAVTPAEPSWSVGSGVPRFLVPFNDVTRASAMCCGPSRPPRLRPQGFSPSRRFPRIPGLRGLRRHVSVASYIAALGRRLRASLERTTAAVQDLPLQGSTRRNRVSLPGPLAPSSFGLASR